MKINKELLKGSTQIMLLSLLSRGDMYGYQMIQELKLISGNVFELKEGTIYPLLHALEGDGAVASYWKDTSEGRRRKYYRLTDAGRLMLKDRRSEWTDYVTAVNKVIGGEEI